MSATNSAQHDEELPDSAFEISHTQNSIAPRFTGDPNKSKVMLSFEPDKWEKLRNMQLEVDRHLLNSKITEETDEAASKGPHVIETQSSLKYMSHLNSKSEAQPTDDRPGSAFDQLKRLVESQASTDGVIDRPATQLGPSNDHNTFDESGMDVMVSLTEDKARPTAALK